MTHLIFSFLLLSIVLMGCSSVKDSLGISAANVDTYMIEPHDLTLPPDYKARPPRADASTTSDANINLTAVEDALKKS